MKIPINRFFLTAFIIITTLALCSELPAAYWSHMDSGIPPELSPYFTLRGVWGSSGSDVYAVGHPDDFSSGVLLHYDGAAWVPTGIDTKLSSIWGSSSSDIFAVGGNDPCVPATNCPSNILLHYDGDEWSTMDPGTFELLRGVWGTSGSDVFVVGYSGTILHYDGAYWSSMNSGTTDNLYGVWGSSGSDVYAVGDYNGLILYYDGSTWTQSYTQTGEFYADIWGTSDSNIFAAGGEWPFPEGNPGTGKILRYDGTNWTPMDVGTVAYINDIWGTAEDDVFAVGNDGTILHYDGNSGGANGNGTWYPMNSGTSDYLFGVWANTSSDVFAVGDNATILHYSCSEDAECTDNNDCTDDTCNVGTGDCIFTPNSDPCNDGLFCTLTDQCSGGACVGNGDTCAPINCDEGGDTCYVNAFNITNISQDWEGSYDVSITWNSVASLNYDIYLKDDFNDTFNLVDSVIAPGISTFWTDDGTWSGGTHPTSVAQRYYMVSQGGTDSLNTVGFYKIVTNEGMNLISLPLIPFSDALEDVIGSQVTGADNERDADRIWVRNGSTYEVAWLVEGVGPPYDGQWYTGNTPTTITLGADRGAWLQIRTGHGSQEVYLLGEVSSTERTIPLSVGMNLVGTSYPVAVSLGDRSSNDSNLWESGATGADNERDADRLWSRIGSLYENHWLVDGVGEPFDGSWYTGNQPTTLELEPGKAYWIQIRDGHTGFTWIYPKPY